MSEPGSQEYDWEAIERTPEFRELVARRRRFIVPATIFFLAWYIGFILLCGYAKDFMGSSVYEGLTVGYVLALTQFLMVWGLSWMYLRKADREFDPLAERVIERAAAAAGTPRAGEGRFAPAGEAPEGKLPSTAPTTTTRTGGVDR